MRSRRLVTTSLLLLTGPLAAVQTTTDPQRAVAERIPLPEVAPLDVPRWREHVRPTADELRFEEIDWLPDLATGLRRAEAERKPLLLWAMNGHPLGCT